MSSSKNILFIGHRGTGKSSLLSAIEENNSAIECVDLDKFIENKTNSKIPDIFLNSGEAYFRDLEKNSLTEILISPSKKDIRCIALGAGFDLAGFEAPKESNCQWVWLQRETDLLPRVFLNRPRLELNLSPRNEYLQRFFQREPSFSRIADLILLLPEGPNQNQLFTAFNLILNAPKVANCFYTIRPIESKKFDHHWAGSIEIRNDLWTAEQLTEASIALNPSKKILWSVRKNTDLEHFFSLVRPQDWIDVDRELILEIPLKLMSRVQIISSHSQNPPESKNQLLKWSPMIESWEALIRGHNWWTKDPAQRSFLPRSESGQWQWYRLLQSSKQKINFVRAGRSEVGDQPSFYLADSYLTDASHFFAVLGDPVSHSWSPEFHREFAKKYRANFLAVPCRPKEFSVALNFLRELGLSGAAVTSPLKVLAGELSQSKNPVNTLKTTKEGWGSQNTDSMGLSALLKDVPNDSTTAVWGGGGILASLQSIVPKARYFSARTGLDRDALSTENPSHLNFRNLIWAAGPTDQSPLSFNLNWTPEQIFDLNYREDSAAKEWALIKNIKYQSGNSLFKVQGLAQQDFWSST